jgi:glycosyltransferase involved in cell wall biosynthesis
MNSNKLHIVYNTTLVKHYFNSSLHSIITRPPIDLTKVPIQTTKQYVTLITISAHKGGYQLIEIAKCLPHVKFLGVGDQGIQDTTISNIKYISNTRNIREIYEQSSIILMPSAYESWGMVASEAICGGIPVIASQTPGLKENLDYAGIFVPLHSIQQWVDAIQKLLTNAEYYDTVSQQCRTRGGELIHQNEEEFKEMYRFLQGITNN